MFSSNYKKEGSQESFTSQTVQAGKSANMLILFQLTELCTSHSLNTSFKVKRFQVRRTRLYKFGRGLKMKSCTFESELT